MQPLTAVLPSSGLINKTLFPDRARSGVLQICTVALGQISYPWMRTAAYHKPHSRHSKADCNHCTMLKKTHSADWKPPKYITREPKTNKTSESLRIHHASDALRQYRWLTARRDILCNSFSPAVRSHTHTHTHTRTQMRYGKKQFHVRRAWARRNETTIVRPPVNPRTTVVHWRTSEWIKAPSQRRKYTARQLYREFPARRSIAIHAHNRRMRNPLVRFPGQ